MNQNFLFFIVFASLSFIILSCVLIPVFWWRLRKRHRALRDQYGEIIDARDEADRIRKDARKELESVTKQTNDLRAQYGDKRHIYDQLLKEISLFDETLSLSELGFYNPHFDYSDSDSYKSAIIGNREDQKILINAKIAVTCRINWTVDGSSAKGQAMTNRGIRLTLRAFNNECDAAIANCRWNNVGTMEKRIIKSFEAVNKLNESSQIVISPRFLELKLNELYLTHEFREKQRSEREERAELARQNREEQRLLRDLERASEEEQYYEKLLAKARKEAFGKDAAQYN